LKHGKPLMASASGGKTAEVDEHGEAITDESVGEDQNNAASH
jgi:hypothetical protein